MPQRIHHYFGDSWTEAPLVRALRCTQGWRSIAAPVVMLLGILVVPTLALAAQSTPPLYKVQREHVWIPMKDGVRLAADLFMPVGGRPGEKFPAVFKYDPYRKDDNRNGFSECDINLYFVARGYVGACVDVRGSGQSEGHLPPREYSAQELDDGEEIIAWLARQPWSSGAVGIFGKSWSGFNAIQLAMRNPPALKAIITVASTERLYEEDCHYTHGIMNFGDDYNVDIDAQNPRSRSPDFPTDEQTLHNRFDSPPWTLLWLRQQRDDDFWHEPEKPLDAIRVPVLLIGAFLDEYRDTIPRWLSEVKTPVRAIVGPWGHDYPHDVNPGPAIEWRDLAVRWWDQWLKGKETGVMSEPKLAVYMRHWFPPDPRLTHIPGEWRNEDRWPPRDQKIQPYYLRPDHSLSNEDTPAPAVDSLKYVPSIGVQAGVDDFDVQPDQRSVDAFSLVYDSAPLAKDSAILGVPEVGLRASATAPQADWFVRLSDVAPDGSVTLITDGALNGAQRDSMAHPQALEPDKVYALRVRLHFTSWVFPTGHRIRVAISNARWPMFWPTPYAMITSLYLGGPGAQASRLLLPTVPLTSALAPPHFSAVAPADRPTSPQDSARTSPKWTLHRSEFGRPTIVDAGSGQWPEKPLSFPWALYSNRQHRAYEVQDEHPELASYTGFVDMRQQFPNHRELIWHTEWNIHSDRTNFYYDLKRELLEDGKAIRTREWRDTVPRDHQ